MDLFALIAKGKTLLEAVKSGNYRIAADIAGDFLKLVSQFLPPAGVNPTPTPVPGDLMPLTMPTAGSLLELLDKAISLAQMLKAFFGR